MVREDIHEALFALLGKLPGVKVVSRKLKHWADVSEFPAVFQAAKGETAVKSGRGIPTKWTLTFDIYAYVKVEDGQASSPALNDMLDNIMNAVAAPDPIDNKQTLGGLVEDCWIDGQITTDEGTLGELAIAIIPIHIIVAN